VGTPDENDQMIRALQAAYEPKRQPHRRSPRDTKETQIRVRIDLDGTGAPRWPPASASSTTCSTRSPATA
jgi:hypothetical protein